MEIRQLYNQFSRPNPEQIVYQWALMSTLGELEYIRINTNSILYTVYWREKEERGHRKALVE